jgi:hypothetical protein
VLAALATPCPLCGYAIPPEEVRRTGFEKMVCPKCEKEFVPGRLQQIDRKHVDGGADDGKDDD